MIHVPANKIKETKGHKNIDNKEIELKNSLTKQRMRTATTSTQVSPHESLGLEAYVQATSPLRRYLDLIVHRQITNYMKEDELYTKNQYLRRLTRTFQ